MKAIKDFILTKLNMCQTFEKLEWVHLKCEHNISETTRNPQLVDKSDLHHDLDQLLWSYESSSKTLSTLTDTLTKRPQKPNNPIIVP